MCTCDTESRVICTHLYTVWPSNIHRDSLDVAIDSCAGVILQVTYRWWGCMSHIGHGVAGNYFTRVVQVIRFHVMYVSFYVRSLCFTSSIGQYVFGFVLAIMLHVMYIGHHSTDHVLEIRLHITFHVTFHVTCMSTIWHNVTVHVQIIMLHVRLRMKVWSLAWEGKTHFADQSRVLTLIRLLLGWG